MEKLSQNETEILIIKGIVWELFCLTQDCIPLNVAYSFNEKKISIWVTIENDDDEAEDIFLTAEAVQNSKYSKYGYHINSTILEKRDNVAIPSDYTILFQ